jgi:hypothetical protein
MPQRRYADVLAENGAFGTEVRANALKAIEQLIPAATNKPAGTAVEAKITKVHHNSCDLTTSIAETQALYNGGPANGVSIVLCAENHLYQQQTRPVKTQKLSGKNLAEKQRDWDKSDLDRQRATGLLLTTGGVAYPAPDLVVFERGMQYTAPTVPATAREDNLTAPTINPGAGQGLRGAERSFVIAGYVFLCVAGGNQTHHDRVMIFFGENHTDIVEHFEYLARHSSADWVQRRPRHFLIVPSHVQ